jgi:hypothetical protein
MSVRRIIKKLKPTELFDIVTRGTCDVHLTEIKREITELKGEWFLNNWNNEIKIDVLKIYLSDSGFQLYTTREEAESLCQIFKSWDMFYDVWSNWYGGSTYTVGFSYDDEAFYKLHNEWLRNKKLEELVNE